MTDKAFIWRLEGRNGWGPYNLRGSIIRESIGDYYSWSRNPAPWDDGIEVPRFSFDEEGWRFGFCELAEARAWWNEPRDAPLFDRAGVHLVAYDRRTIRQRALGGHQVAFITPAEPVARLAVCVLWALDDATITSLAERSARDSQRLAHMERPPNRLPQFA